jgi:cell division protein FtsI/penicillin-binding protein 2
LAVSIPVDSIYVHPAKVKSVKEAVRKLVPLLGISPAILLKRLESDKNFVWLDRKVKKGLGAKVKELDISGLNYVGETKRFYPNGELAANVLGFVGMDGEGLGGLELYYNRYLRGAPGWIRTDKDARGRTIITFRDEYSPPIEGLNLVLTIDEVIQHIAEQELEKVFQKSKAKGAIIIIMNPGTGGILALADRPTFDPNSFQDYSAAQRRDRAVTDGFEPGSTFKVVTAAAALQEGLFHLQDKLFCENGSYRLARRTIRDAEPYGWLTFKQVIEFSSNIGAVKIAAKLGKEKLYNYITSFGFGTRTGIDLPGEIDGLVRPPRAWSKFSMGSIPYGQEVMVTAIQLIAAVSAVANGGVLMHPRIVDSIINKNGEVVKRFVPRPVRRVLSPSIADKLTSILVGVVDKGTGKKARLKEYRVAGKTGTAQVAGRGGYLRGKFVASFVGYLPADNPQIAILVVVDEPQGNYYGGAVAAPVFRRVAEQVMIYLKMKGGN